MQFVFVDCKTLFILLELTSINHSLNSLNCLNFGSKRNAQSTLVCLFRKCFIEIMIFNSKKYKYDWIPLIRNNTLTVHLKKLKSVFASGHF